MFMFSPICCCGCGSVYGINSLGPTSNMTQYFSDLNNPNISYGSPKDIAYQKIGTWKRGSYDNGNSRSNVFATTRSMTARSGFYQQDESIPVQFISADYQDSGFVFAWNQNCVDKNYQWVHKGNLFRPWSGAYFTNPHIHDRGYHPTDWTADVELQMTFDYYPVLDPAELLGIDRNTTYSHHCFWYYRGGLNYDALYGGSGIIGPPFSFVSFATLVWDFLNQNGLTLNGLPNIWFGCRSLDRYIGTTDSPDRDNLQRSQFQQYPSSSSYAVPSQTETYCDYLPIDIPSNTFNDFYYTHTVNGTGYKYYPHLTLELIPYSDVDKAIRILTELATPLDLTSLSRVVDIQLSEPVYYYSGLYIQDDYVEEY